MHNMKNTCSIKLLKKAYIGYGVRMTSDKNTVSFDNIPMKNMLIEEYNQQGFLLSHEKLPRKIWVDFEQLPLTRLCIKNGIIEDELTFVENIVRHKMQLIRTLDTEYIDLLYKEKELKETTDIISLSNAVPGNYYKGAQCKEGTEMIFLGCWFTKSIVKEIFYRSSGNDYKYYLSKLSPKRAFFLVKNDEISSFELRELCKDFRTFDCSRSWWYCYYSVKHLFKDQDEFNTINTIEKEELNKRKKDYLSKNKLRYKLINYPVTSKIIKNLIFLNKSDSNFNDIKFNKELIIKEVFVVNRGFRRTYYSHNYNVVNTEDNNFIINDIGFNFDCDFICESKQNINDKAEAFITNYYKIPLEEELSNSKY